MDDLIVPDRLSGWVLPPPSACDAGPVRVFDTAAEAMAFLKMLREHGQRGRPKAGVAPFTRYGFW